eukprot:895583_1
MSYRTYAQMECGIVDAATFVPKSSKMRLKPVKEEDYGPDADGKVRISYRLSADFHHKCVESRGVGCCIDKEGKCKGCFEYMKQYCAMQHNDGQLSRDAIQTKNGSLITFVNWSRHCYVTKEDLYGVIVENRSDKWQRYRWLLKENTTASQIVNTYHDAVYAWHLPISPLEMNWFTLQNAVSIIRMRFRSLKELNHSLAASLQHCVRNRGIQCHGMKRECCLWLRLRVKMNQCALNGSDS